MKRNKHVFCSFISLNTIWLQVMKGALNMRFAKIMAMAGVLLAAGAVFAAEGEASAQQAGANPAPGPAEMRPPMPGAIDLPGTWVSRFLMQDENLDKLGMEGEPRKKLVDGLGEIVEKMKDLQKKIREAGLEQGKMMREAMETQGADMSAVFAKVKEIGDMRTEQSLLSTKVFVVIRDNLTKEQHAMVRELVMKEGRQRMEARREFMGNMDRRRPQFPPFEGRHPGGPKGHGRRRGFEGRGKGPGAGPEAGRGDAPPPEKPADKPSAE